MLAKTVETPLSCRCAQLLKKLVFFFSIAMVIGWQSPGYSRGLDFDEQKQAGELANRVPWMAEQRQKLQTNPLGIQTFVIEWQEDKQFVTERCRKKGQSHAARQFSIPAPEADRNAPRREAQATPHYHMGASVLSWRPVWAALHRSSRASKKRF